MTETVGKNEHLVSEGLADMYDGYYASGPLVKRELSARDSAREIAKLLENTFPNSLLDVGAGDGAVLDALEKAKVAENTYAAEISNSGLKRIRELGLSTLREAVRFDGYNIPFSEKQFDVAIAIYVLEHVEHERLFLRALGRVANHVVIAVPLEHTFRVRRSIQAGKSIGHINFYTEQTFRSLLETSGLLVEDLNVYTTSREYEVHVSPRFGRLKYGLRSSALSVSRRLATAAMNYMAIALCRTDETSCVTTEESQ